MMTRLLAMGNRAITMMVGENAHADWIRAVSATLDRVTPSTLVPLPTTSFVAPGGNDGTAQRGQIEAPFLTVGAAVTASQSGDAIYVSPGVYPENIDIAVLNPTLASLTIFGAGNDSQIDSIAWVCPAEATYLRVANLRLAGAGPNGSFFVDGTASEQEMRVEGEFVTLARGGLLFGVFAGKLDGIVTEVAFPLGGALTISDCGDVYVGGDSVLNGGLTLSFTNAAVISRGVYTVKESTVFGFDFIGEPPTHLPALLLLGHPNVYVDPSVRLVSGDSKNSISVDGSALDVDLDNEIGPDITIQARCDARVLLVFAPVEGTAAVNACDLSRGQFRSDVLVSVSAPDPLTTTYVTAHNASFLSGVQAGQSTVFDIRESYFLQDNLFQALGSDGTIDRDQHTVEAGFDGAAPFQTTITFVPPFPAGLGDADFNAIANSLDAPVVSYAGVTGFSGTGATVTFGAASSAARITVIRTNTFD